jgi:thiamine-phosphate pyrophosphorylase
MLVVISSPDAIADEANIINALFEEGLEILHLRKPGIERGGLEILLKKIKPQYMHQIALHQRHQIAADWGISRLHFTETKRAEMSKEEWGALKQADNILSTSVHDIEAYKQLPPVFDYTFFGPVFNSISKEGYLSVTGDDFVFPVVAGLPKVIAIGGINGQNIQRVKAMGFSGAAVLGMIWRQPDDSAEQLKKVRTAWKQAGQWC